jgi:hypothetical protein
MAARNQETNEAISLAAWMHWELDTKAMMTPRKVSNVKTWRPRYMASHGTDQAKRPRYMASHETDQAKTARVIDDRGRQVAWQSWLPEKMLA